MFSHLFRVTHMSLKLGVVMDPIESINYKKDTTLALLWAARPGLVTVLHRAGRAVSRGEVPMADHARSACTGPISMVRNRSGRYCAIVRS